MVSHVGSNGNGSLNLGGINNSFINQMDRDNSLGIFGSGGGSGKSRVIEESEMDDSSLQFKELRLESPEFHPSSSSTSHLSWNPSSRR